MNVCLMQSSTAAQEVGGAVLAAGKTQLALTVRDAERTSLDTYRSGPAKTVTVMQWVSYTRIFNKAIVHQSHSFTLPLLSSISPCNRF